MSVQIGQTAVIKCKSFLSDGTPLDEPEDQEPFPIEAGEETDVSIARSISKAVVGMDVGETKKLTLSSEEAFGDYDEDRVVEVAASDLPEDIAEGDMLTFENEGGDEMEGYVKAVRDESILVDLNHPLAGQELMLEVTVISLES